MARDSRTSRFQRTPRDAVLQRHALEKLHGDERLAVLLADVVNGADVGMIQCRCRLRFALKTAEGLRIACHFVRQELQSDEAVQPCVLGFVDDAHAAATEFLDNAVVRDGLANHERRMLGGGEGQVNENGDLAPAREFAAKDRGLTHERFRSLT